jgi:hypothetical protein
LLAYRNPEDQRRAVKRWQEAHPGNAAERMRRWRQRNPERDRENHERGRERRAAYIKARAAERREALGAYKRQRGCADCGMVEGELHFDHRPGTEKRFSIAVAMSYSWDAIWAEVAKCEIRCNSCHGKRHAAVRRAKK